MGVARKVLTAGSVAAGAGFACAAALTATARAACKLRSKWLRGKIVLITGSSRGLGLALAEEFGRMGTKLALNARDSSELERARALLLRRRAVQDKNDIAIFAGDLRKAEDANELIAQVTGHFGRIDVLVNNAGIITVGPVENQTIDDFRNVMDTNFFAGLHCTLSVLPQMLARRSGSIVNISSIGGKLAVPHMLPYTASKFAVTGFSEGLATELSSKGIRVTTVCPGLMRTGSHLNALFKGDAEREYRWFSLGASFPGISISARSAARKIIRATAFGRREISITPQAMLAARIHGLCPATTSRGMQLMNFALPPASADREHVFRGAEVRSKEWKPSTVLGQAAARRYNQMA
jgi:NAD(P)-dependent dehydrogenase (short-subunit alcohol dehydrogenase family)